jgi:hypothetical protein
MLKSDENIPTLLKGMKKLIVVTLAAAGILTGASSFQGCSKNDCVPGQPNASCICPMVYDPVCGCDGVSYGNSCEAECAGVSEYYHNACD